MSNQINMTEVYFEWWLNELKSIGLINHYDREPKSFVLEDPEVVFFHQHYKSKEPLVKSFNLFRPITYTPDYRVFFNFKLASKLFGVIQRKNKILLDCGHNKPGSVYQETLFYTSSKLYFLDDNENKEIEVWFDVKPPSKAIQFSGALGSSREFPYNQRMMYNKHNIIVNKVVPIGTSNSLFAKTFIPERYRFTDLSGQPRKLKEYEKKSKTLLKYLESKEIQL